MTKPSSKAAAFKIVTLDGPAGSGKSTVARILATRLEFLYLDTGAMYRAVTLKAMQLKLDLSDSDGLVKMAKNTEVDLINIDDQLKVVLDGKDVSSEIRTLEVTENTHWIAKDSRIREVMVQWQRTFAKKGDVVAEGRDVGTVVFPNADFKFYLDADLKERAQRRKKELVSNGTEVQEEIIQEQIRIRDESDMTREISPLRKADDAKLIDTSGLNIQQVVEKILETIV